MIASVCPVRPADKDHIAEKKVSLYLKKYIFKKKRQPLYIGDAYDY